MPTIVETVMFPAIVGGVKELSDTANDHQKYVSKRDLKFQILIINTLNIPPLSIISGKVGNSTKICTKF